MANMEQVNELLKEKIAESISRNVPIKDSLVTIIYVDCAPNMQNAKVAFSVIPDNHLGTALEKLRKSTGVVASDLKKNTRLRKIPRLNWVYNNTEKKASELDEIFNQIEKERDGEESEEEINAN